MLCYIKVRNIKYNEGIFKWLYRTYPYLSLIVCNIYHLNFFILNNKYIKLIIINTNTTIPSNIGGLFVLLEDNKKLKKL